MIKVFIVDDDHLTIELLIKPLQDSGKIMYVGKANNGKECIEILENKPVDVVLMDVIMPIMDGIEAAEHLCKAPSRTTPKIIFLTVFNDYSYAKKAFELRASIIGKNIGIDYLITTIERVYNGEQIINLNPEGLAPFNGNTHLRKEIECTLNAEQIEIACLIRQGKTTEKIVSYLNKKYKEKNYNDNYINNQKRVIFQKLSPFIKDDEINAAMLGAIMESSGICPPLDLTLPPMKL
jgi:DNA-binding NarL/FixJ family response regulator